MFAQVFIVRTNVVWGFPNHIVLMSVVGNSHIVFGELHNVVGEYHNVGDSPTTLHNVVGEFPHVPNHITCGNSPTTLHNVVGDFPNHNVGIPQPHYTMWLGTSPTTMWEFPNHIVKNLPNYILRKKPYYVLYFLRSTAGKYLTKLLLGMNPYCMDTKKEALLCIIFFEINSW